MARKSGLQNEVIKLYRSCLRVVRQKPPEAQPKFLLYLGFHFRHPSKGGGVSKRDVSTIEYYLRQGHKTLEMWQNPSIKDCWVTREMTDWSRSHPGRKLSSA